MRISCGNPTTITTMQHMPYEFHVALLCFANCYRWRMKDEKTVRFDSSYCCQKKTTHQQSCIKLKKRYIQVFRPYDMPNKLSTLLFLFAWFWLFLTFSLRYKRKVLEQRHIYRSQYAIILMSIFWFVRHRTRILSDYLGVYHQVRRNFSLLFFILIHFV